MMRYRWLPLTVSKYDDVLEQHGGTFLVSRTSYHLQVWSVSPLDDAPGYVAIVTYYPAHYSAGDVHADQRVERTRPDHEELMRDINEMWELATHFIMGYPSEDQP